MPKSETLTVNGSKVKVSLILFVQAIVVAFMCGAIWVDLKNDIRRLGTDRWTKTDDKVYMLELKQLNPAIALPSHERSSTDGRGGR